MRTHIIHSNSHSVLSPECLLPGLFICEVTNHVNHTTATCTCMVHDEYCKNSEAILSSQLPEQKKLLRNVMFLGPPGQLQNILFRIAPAKTKLIKSSSKNRSWVLFYYDSEVEVMQGKLKLMYFYIKHFDCSAPLKLWPNYIFFFLH